VTPSRTTTLSARARQTRFRRAPLSAARANTSINSPVVMNWEASKRRVSRSAARASGVGGVTIVAAGLGETSMIRPTGRKIAPSRANNVFLLL
jgi:hypothetical protein